MAAPIIGTSYGGLTSMSWNGSAFEGRLPITIVTGQNVLCVRFSGAFPVAGWSSLTFNGFSLVLRRNEGDGDVSMTSIYDLDNPSVGTYDLVYQRGGDTTGSRVCANGISGVDTGTPRGTPNSASGFSATMSTTVTTAVDDLVVDCVHHENGPISANGSQTVQDSGATNLTYYAGFSSKVATTTSTAMTWTVSGALWYAISAIGYKGATGGGGGATINDHNYRGSNRGMGLGMGRGLSYHQHPMLSLEAYRREQARKHREFMATVARRAA